MLCSLKKTVLLAIALFEVPSATPQKVMQAETATRSQSGVPQHQLRVANATPWYCRLASVNKKAREFVDLAPGETASTAVKGANKSGLLGVVPFARESFVWYARSADINVTLAALMYADPMHKQYIGATIGAVRVPGAGATSFSSVLIKPENVWLVEGFDQSTIRSGQTGLSQIERPLEVNYTVGDGVGIQAFIWNSETPASVMLNRSAQGLIHQGEIYYVAGHSQTRITVAVEELSGELRRWEQSFNTNGVSGVSAQVFVLGRGDLH